MKRDTAVRVNVSLPRTLHQAAQAYAKEQGTTLSALITDLLTDTVKRAETGADNNMRELVRDLLLHDPEVKKAIVRNTGALTEHLTTPTPTRQKRRRAAGDQHGRVPITPELFARIDKWSVKDLAEKMGVTHSIVSKVKRGQSHVSHATFEKLTKAIESLENSR